MFRPLQVFGRGNELLQGTRKAIELPHDKRVARAQNVVEDSAQLRPIDPAAGCPLSIDLFTAGGRERMQLGRKPASM